MYQYKDYLGNVRLSYADVDDNNIIDPVTEILEVNNYYPFGLQHTGYGHIDNEHRSEEAEQYKLNGKEYEDALGLNGGYSVSQKGVNIFSFGFSIGLGVSATGVSGSINYGNTVIKY